MEVAAQKSSDSDGSVKSICKFPFWQSTEHSSVSSSSHTNNFHHNQIQFQSQRSAVAASSASVSSVAKSLLPTRRRLVLDPPNKLYFPCMIYFSSSIDLLEFWIWDFVEIIVYEIRAFLGIRVYLIFHWIWSLWIYLIVWLFLFGNFEKMWI